MSSPSLARLPLELEREIFETAAIFYPQTIPTLLLVSARVYQWIEPVKYRTFHLTEHRSPSSSAPLSVLLGAIQSKSASFIRDNVWNLYLTIYCPKRLSLDVLDRCSGVRSLVLIYTDSGMLARLAHARPYQLTVDIDQLFRGRPRIDLAMPLFSALTHLSIFNFPSRETAHTIWTGLSKLSTLTHLAVSGLFSERDEVLSICHNVKIVIGIHIELWVYQYVVGDEDQWREEENPRFVTMLVQETERFADWEAGVRGGMDMWARADAFVAKKRRGEIPGYRHWIEKCDKIAVRRPSTVKQPWE